MTEKTNKINLKELVEKIKGELPPELSKCQFEEIQGWLTIRPDGFLGADLFEKLRAIVMANGGEYCSASRFSHFRIRIKEPEKSDVPTLKQWYDQQETVAKPEEPLAAQVTVNLNFNVAKASEVTAIMTEIRKNVKPLETKNGKKKV